MTNKIKKYTPGFNIHDVEKKYNLKKVVKLASNENPFISKDVISFIKKSTHKLNLYPDSNPVNLHSEIGNHDIIINATSLGLKNGQDFDFNFDQCKDEATYIDTIYNPIKTKTIKFLEDKGINVFNGLDMFIYQGQKSFYLWNKINPEIDNSLINLLLSKLK